MGIDGLGFCTPRHIILKESYIGKLKTELGIRALRYDKYISEQDDDRLTKICWKEKLDELYSQEKEKYYNGLGMSSQGVEVMKSLGKNV